ncbi:hypothetical protein AB0I81_13675 [Nonomuraea sp. NPDC050404]|uniref:hypothetical protein n=1 Tax=Nonomuraea sp. NPDC050404 TaxID=3155783 RepID=UPI0034068D30
MKIAIVSVAAVTTVAGVVLSGAPAQAAEPEGAYWRVKQIPGDAAGVRKWVDGKVAEFITEYLRDLLYQYPLTEKVRGAAYEAVKATKGVTDLGRVKDSLGRTGRKLGLPTYTTKGSSTRQQVVVDDKAMTLLATHVEMIDSVPGGKSLVENRDTTYEAGWTNDKPAVPDAK